MFKKIFYAVKNFGLKRKIKKLGPWYQPIEFSENLKVVAVDKSGNRFYPSDPDRGITKWHNVIEPNLPFELSGKRVLDVGCNAGLYLIESIKKGAIEAVGLEKDKRYLSQAQFVRNTFQNLNKTRQDKTRQDKTRQDKTYYPLTFINESLDTFDFSLLGNFDIVYLFSVIYHVGKSKDYSHLSKDEIFSLQVEILKRIAKQTQYLLFQAYTIQDDGRGSGRDSLLQLIQSAGLIIEKETIYENDARGYILLVKGTLNTLTSVKVNQLCNKYFKPAISCAEKEIVANLIKGENGKFNLYSSEYYRLRTGRINWNDKDIANIPDGLDKKPVYWVMPWSYRRKNISFNKKAIKLRDKNFPFLLDKFNNLFNLIIEEGYDDIKGALPGYLLIHPSLGERFIYIDGNHRAGILGYLFEQNKINYAPVKILMTVYRDKIYNYPIVNQLISEGFFSHSDVLKWFDYIFEILPNVE